MDIYIRDLEKRDFKLARKFAIEGMNLNWYATTRLTLLWYSHYFWNLELLKASQAFGAYHNNTLVGVLLVDINGQDKLFHSKIRSFFVKFSDFIISGFFSNSSDAYNQANKYMLHKFMADHEPDGEIIFFATDPVHHGKGVGSLLLNKLEEEQRGKLIYLFTDSGSTYQFYQKKSFQQSGRCVVEIRNGDDLVTLVCYIFHKVLGT